MIATRRRTVPEMRAINRRSVIRVGVAAGRTFGFAACGNATETGVENLIESQGGGDVDVDLNGDGGFAVQTEEGGMSIDEDGNFVITDADGSVVTGNADSENGEFNMESDEGSFSSGSTTELPEEWPSEIPHARFAGDRQRQRHLLRHRAGDHGHRDRRGRDLRRELWRCPRGRGFRRAVDIRHRRDTINNVYERQRGPSAVIYFGESSDSQVTVSVYSNVADVDLTH